MHQTLASHNRKGKRSPNSVKVGETNISPLNHADENINRGTSELNYTTDQIDSLHIYKLSITKTCWNSFILWNHSRMKIEINSKRTTASNKRRNLSKASESPGRCLSGEGQPLAHLGEGENQLLLQAVLWPQLMTCGMHTRQTNKWRSKEVYLNKHLWTESGSLKKPEGR